MPCSTTCLCHLSNPACCCWCAGLTQTLNEFRQTTAQLQKLQSHEVRRLQAVEAATKAGSTGTGSAGSRTPPRPASLSGAADTPEQPNGAAVAMAGSAGGFQASPGSSPKAGSMGRGVPSPGAAERAAAATAVAAAAVAATPQAAEATRIAEQLEDVAGGADSGLLAEAAVALRELSRREAELATAQQVGCNSWVCTQRRDGGQERWVAVKIASCVSWPGCPLLCLPASRLLGA